MAGEQEYWVPFKHPAPYAGQNWAVKTPKGTFGFRTKKIAQQFCDVSALKKN